MTSHDMTQHCKMVPPNHTSTRRANRTSKEQGAAAKSNKRQARSSAATSNKQGAKRVQGAMQQQRATSKEQQATSKEQEAALQDCKDGTNTAQVRQDYPLNLSISVSGGRETNKDSHSNGE
jgi:hypothetical protein